MEPNVKRKSERPRTFNSIAELEDAVDQDLGTTAWLEVTQEMVDDFARVTRDHQWIHVDTRRAAGSPLGGTIAHGYLTLSLLPGFSEELYTIRIGSARLNYGLEKVRFTAPVLVGTRIRATPIITSVKRAQAGTQVHVTWTVAAEGAGRPACIAESITLVLP